MIKIEFPADRTDIALAIGQALTAIGKGRALVISPAPTTATECPGDCGANSKQIADLGAAAAAPEPNAPSLDGSGDSYDPPGDVAIGTRPGSVFEATDNGALPQVDPKGVAFNAAMCGIAAKPFYESGKQPGQWKKRKGVDQAAYDAWYAEQLEQGAAQTTVDTAGAFPTTEPVHTHAPTTCGDFMGWASKKQAAGLLTQADITEAYATASLVITDLFPPNGDAVIAERVAVLYNALSAKAGA
jgi:hypothetical protein